MAIRERRQHRRQSNHLYERRQAVRGDRIGTCAVGVHSGLAGLSAEKLCEKRFVGLSGVAIIESRTRHNDLSHPVGRVGPENAPRTHGMDQILEVPMEQEPGDHRVKQVRVKRALHRGAETIRSAVEPNLADRSEEHTSELQSLAYLVCRLLLEKKK